MSSGGGLPGPPPLTFDDVLRHNTGWAVPTEHWEEGRARRRALMTEDARIADALETEGTPVRTGTQEAVAVGLATGRVEPVQGYRAIRFLQSIAQRDRQPLLNALRYYARHDPGGSYLRLVVVTGGDRVPLYGDLRPRMQEIHRRISRFAHEASQRFGIEVVYRGTEFTVDDTLTFHVHANLLLAPRAFLPRQQWSAFLAWMHGFLGTHVRDNGRLRKPEEAIKYPFKPAELCKLDGPALAWVYRQTQKLKIAQPLGRFREFWRRLKKDRLKVALVALPDGARLNLVHKASRAAPGAKSARACTARQENQLLCLSAPQARFSRFKEPVALIRGYSLQPETSTGRRRLEAILKWQREARRWWIENGAPDPATSPVEREESGSPTTASERPRGRDSGGNGLQARPLQRASAGAVAARARIGRPVRGPDRGPVPDRSAPGARTAREQDQRQRAAR